MHTALAPLVSLLRRPDLALTLLVVVALATLLIPMPAPLLDVLLSCNIALAATLLLVALSIPQPLALSSLPSILLLSTLFRLALNVSTTRLILLDAWAGTVVDAFGRFVVQGSVLVGAVVFLIITIIQFVVIAKGAERVAEVAARFSLDAMPGRQLAIDADLRAGALSQTDAAQAREDLHRQSTLYGALDGAMKFVKGDAVASIAITAINLGAGIVTGVALHDLSLADAARTFALLSIGDGLVAQVPALLTATAAAIVVTRVQPDAPRHLGADIAQQLLRHPAAIAAAAATLAVLALIPGLPFFPFLLVAALLGAVAWAARRARPDAPTTPAPSPPLQPALVLTLPPRLLDDPDPQTLAALRDGLAEALRLHLGPTGLPTPSADLCLDAQPRITLTLHGIPAAQLTAPEHHTPILAWPEELTDLATTPGTTSTALPPLLWIADEHRAQLPPQLATLSPQPLLQALVARLLPTCAWRLVTVPMTHALLQRLPPDQQPLREAAALSTAQLTQTLRRLAAEHLPVQPLHVVLDAAAHHAHLTRDPTGLAELARRDLAPLLRERALPPAERLQTIVADREVEHMLRASIRQTEQGPQLNLPPDLTRQLQRGADTLFQRLRQSGRTPIVVTQPDVRRFLADLLLPICPGVLVLAADELPPDLTLNPIAQLRPAPRS